MSRPKRILVEFEDGTRREADISQMGRQGWIDLARLGLVDLHAAPEPPAAYALLEWRKGWKEAVAVDSDVMGLLRYYTLERVEEVGRLALEKSGDYPQLILVDRLPRDVKSLMLARDAGTSMYLLEEKEIAKEGGKTEHILYDAKNPKFVKQDDAQADARMAELKALAGDELKKKNLDGTRVLSMDDEQKAEVLNGLARALRIRAMERQADLHGFLQHLIEGH
jgi:hypothetical protein